MCVWVYVSVWVCVYVLKEVMNCVTILLPFDDFRRRVKYVLFLYTYIQASYMSTHTEELWYNETVCLLMTIYAPHGGWSPWQRNLQLPLAMFKALRMNWALWCPVRQKCKQTKATT